MTLVGRPILFLRRAVFWAALAITAFISACSTNYLYERLDSFVVWRVDGVVNLTSLQKNDLQQDLQGYLDQVRIAEMPRAAEYISSVADQIASGFVTPADIDARYYEGMELYEELALGVVPISREFLLGLSQEQVVALVDSFYDMNDEMYEEYSGRTAEEREKNRNKSAVKGIEDFTGKLSKAQKDLITSRIASMADSSQQWIEYQREWQDQFKELLLNPPAEPQFTEELTTLFVYPRQFHSQEYKAIVEANRQIFNVMMADLLASLTPKQKARMLRELDEYVKILTKLSRKPV